MPFDGVRDRREIGHERALFRARRVRHDGDGRLRRAAPRDERRRRASQRRQPHVEHEGPFRGDARGEIVGRAVVEGLAAMGRHERHAGRDRAMGERNARRRRRPDRRADPGHDLERDAQRGELFGLFPSATEDHRIAALEANDLSALERAFEHPRMDGRRVRARAAATSHGDAFGVRRRDREDVVGDELVVRHDTRA